MNFVLLLAVNIEKHEQETDEKEKDPPSETLETNNKEILVMDNFKNII